MKIFIGLIAGLLFGLGLTVSQMVNPSKVFSFLDVFGHWDPSLAFVMMGAITVFASGYFLFVRKRTKSLLGQNMPTASQTSIDKNLLIGSAIFGIGWGLAGICPGPAIVNLGGGEIKVAVFIVVMVAGMKVANFLKSS